MYPSQRWHMWHITLERGLFGAFLSHLCNNAKFNDLLSIDWMNFVNSLSYQSLYDILLLFLLSVSLENQSFWNKVLFENIILNEKLRHSVWRKFFSVSPWFYHVFLKSVKVEIILLYVTQAYTIPTHIPLSIFHQTQ